MDDAGRHVSFDLRDCKRVAIAHGSEATLEFSVLRERGEAGGGGRPSLFSCLCACGMATEESVEIGAPHQPVEVEKRVEEVGVGQRCYHICLKKKNPYSWIKSNNNWVLPRVFFFQGVHPLSVEFPTFVRRGGRLSLPGFCRRRLDGVANLDRALTIQAGSYYDCVMPEDAEALWGPVPLRRLPDGVENTCKAVTHG